MIIQDEHHRAFLYSFNKGIYMQINHFCFSQVNESSFKFEADGMEYDFVSMRWNILNQFKTGGEISEEEEKQLLACKNIEELELWLSKCEE